MTGRQRRSRTARLVVLIILLMLLMWLLWRVFIHLPPAPRPKVTTGALSIALRGAEVTLDSCTPTFAPAQGVFDQSLALRDAFAINH